MYEFHNNNYKGWVRSQRKTKQCRSNHPISSFFSSSSTNDRRDREERDIFFLLCCCLQCVVLIREVWTLNLVNINHLSSTELRYEQNRPFVRVPWKSSKLAIFEALANARLFRASVDQSAVQGGKRFTFVRVLQRDREIEQQSKKNTILFLELLP